MKTKQILAVILGAMFICSCSDVLDNALGDEVIIEKDYSIPMEDALASLENFMIDAGRLPETKGGLTEYIKDSFTVSGLATKSGENYEDVLYVINFVDDGGYALLSADSRIQEDIIAITDSGSASEADFNEPVYDRIPSENDDLSVSEFDEMVESGVLAEEQSQVNYECLLYAMGQIETNQDDVIEIGSPCDPGPGGGGGTGGAPITYQWEIVKEVPRMLNTAWTQRTINNDIFNKYCPEVGLIWRTKAPAGCVCIATAQIIAYHEYPANLTCDGVQIDYPEIKRIYSYDEYNGTGTETSQEMLARFCKTVGVFCNTQYHSIFNKPWGFAWPWDAKSCLEMFGYQNVSLNWGYDESRILTSLNNGYPVFMSALRELWTGHAWVVDGYIMRNYVSSNGVVDKSQTLVHCNWGWHGVCNGYFTSGIFKTDEVVLPDNLSSEQRYRNYNMAINTITYDITHE